MVEDLIYDVGMHNGDDTAYYLFLGYRVIAIEADPDLASRGATRFSSELSAGQLTICNVGIAATEGELPFYLCDPHTEWNTFDESLTSRAGATYRQIMVSTCRFGSLLAKHGVPAFLKIDIEGHDILCLEDLNSGDLPRHLSIEMSQEQGLEIPRKLHQLGYTAFKCISQINHLPVQFPHSHEQGDYERARRAMHSTWLPARIFRKLGGRRWLQKRLDRVRQHKGWVFPGGSSGRFGDETPGRWQTIDEICKTYTRFRQMADEGRPSIFWGTQSYSFWADFHARCDR